MLLQVMHLLLSAVSASHAGLRQGGCYGIRIVAMKAQQAFKPFAPQTLQQLAAIVSDPEVCTCALIRPFDATYRSMHELCHYLGQLCLANFKNAGVLVVGS